MELTSPSFRHEGSIPTEFTCEGADGAPELAWQGAPAGTQSFALIVDDPDAPDPRAPKMTWVHWVLVDLPADSNGIAQGEAPRGRVGMNDWKKAAWGGPCPPIGRHRYFFKLYALDTTLPQLASPTKPELEAAMKGHVLAEAQLMGTYEKKARVK
jgi:Raf kinase inhibitor-like YbhB/YbcL family protein